MLEHIGDILGASFCQDDVKKCSKSLKIARNCSNFVARFRSHTNMCSNSVPTAALAGVRTLCQQQNQGRCWHQKRSNSAPQCSNVRTKTLVRLLDSEASKIPIRDAPSCTQSQSSDHSTKSTQFGASAGSAPQTTSHKTVLSRISGDC